MKPCAIVGMGPGVSLSIAKRFGREGFAIAMLARRPEATIWGVVNSAPQFEPDRIAESYWQLHAQPPSAFEREVVLR